MKTITINRNIDFSEIIQELKQKLFHVIQINNFESELNFQRYMLDYSHYQKELEKKDRLKEWKYAEDLVNKEREKRIHESWNVEGNLITDMLLGYSIDESKDQCDQDPDRLANIPLRALRKIARKIDLKGFSRIKKDDLIQNIKKMMLEHGLDQAIIENEIKAHENSIIENQIRRREKHYEKHGKTGLIASRLARNDVLGDNVLD